MSIVQTDTSQSKKGTPIGVSLLLSASLALAGCGGNLVCKWIPDEEQEYVQEAEAEEIEKQEAFQKNCIKDE